MTDPRSNIPSQAPSQAAPQVPHSGEPSAAGKTAVLIVNTGSPEAPTREAVARYLLEFLGDRRVVELSPLIWQPILRGIIIPRRAQASAERYKTVWTAEGSPLTAITAKTARALQETLGSGSDVHWAMCYGTQRVPEVLEAIARTRPARLVVLPMFAQFATQTTQAVFDALERALKRVSFPCSQDNIARIISYHDHPRYIEALACAVRRHWRSHSKEGPAAGEKRMLLMSFHGIPQASSDRGDPYEGQCRETAALLAQALGLEKDDYCVAFQSKFGRAKWLAPSSIETVESLARLGVRHVDVVCPGFAADCLETLEEIAQELKATFIAAGGESFSYIGALNDAPEAVALYADLVREAAASIKSA